MRWEYRIGRIAGIDVSIHLTTVLLIAYWLWPAMGISHMATIVTGARAVLLLLSVLLHELGHAVVARRHGIGVRRVLLWPLGGLALLDREPTRPRDQILIFAAGPLVNLALAGLAWLLLGAIPFLMEQARLTHAPLMVPLLYIRDQLTFLMRANVVLALANLVPVYPLDGGRIIRPLLARWLGAPRADRALLVVSAALAAAFVGYAWLRGDALMRATAPLILLGALTLDPRISAALDRWILFVINRGEYEARRGNHERAIAHFTRRLRRRPNDVAALQGRGLASLHTGQHELADADLERAIAVQERRGASPAQRAHAHALRAYIATEAKDDEAAQAFAAQALALQPADLMALTITGVVQLQRGDPAAALQVFEQASAVAPRDAMAHSNRGYVRWLLGDGDGALVALDAAIACDSRLAHAHMNRGHIWVARGDAARALTDYTRAVELAPAFHLPSYHRAALRFSQGDLDGARQDIERALAAKASELLRTDEDWQERWLPGRLAWALQVADWAAASDTASSHAHLWRGDAYRANGQPDAAIAVYTVSIARDPEDGAAYLRRARAYHQRGGDDFAREDLARALERRLTPNDRRAAEALLAQLTQRAAALAS